ncbi:MAG: HypC/HybG/HupF family hydrogenase formation chaperone [Thermodesulfobacteriota bacterium]|nr:HypC/HybG/HupF family hydrogenase formation chaperone [Thermodesulfobacteriota bacterium]
MCLALPARVVSIDETTDSAVVSLGGIKKEISLALVQDVAVNDYVLIHVGFALARISDVEARQTLKLFAEAAQAGRVHEIH